METREWNKCYYEDCLPALKAFPNGYFDMLITDPPWKTGKKSGWREKKGKPINMKDIDYMNYPVEWHLQWITEARRIAKIVIFCVPLKDENEWTKMVDPKGKFILYFKNGFRPTKISLRNSYSPYFTCFDKPPKIKPLYNIFGIVIKAGFLNKTKYKNPSAKSSSFFKYLIKGFNAKTVIDPFMGSGYTAEQCEELGNVKWIGFEIDDKNKPDVEKRVAIGKRAFLKTKDKQKVLF